MDRSKMSLGEKLKLNRSDLATAAEYNHEDLHYYLKQRAACKTEVEEGESLVKRLKAERQLDYRRMPAKDLEEKYGISKTTDEVVKALVEADPVVADAEQKRLAAVKDYNSWDAIVNAFYEKSANIRNLVELHKTGYFSVSN